MGEEGSVVPRVDGAAQVISVRSSVVNDTSVASSASDRFSSEVDIVS
jgi:hypothetical protein